MVSFAKLGSWFLLLTISYTLVSLINRPREMSAREEGAMLPEAAQSAEMFRRRHGRA